MCAINDRGKKRIEQVGSDVNDVVVKSITAKKHGGDGVLQLNVVVKNEESIYIWLETHTLQEEEK